MKPHQNFCNSPSDSEDLLWSTADVANYMRCSERQVYNLRKSGLPAIHIGGLIRFDPQAVREWLASNEASIAAEERASQLADIAASGDEDNTECAAADLAREFPAPGD
jgi:excisionase family DNA binding protein